jgi:L-fucose mutarotase/ribose pyranase (RbsD/FucU family)
VERLGAVLELPLISDSAFDATEVASKLLRSSFELLRSALESILSCFEALLDRLVQLKVF